MSLKQQLRDLSFRIPGFLHCWGAFRDRQLLKSYETRREGYHKSAVERGLKYSEANTISMINERFEKRKYVPKKHSVGNIHTFAIVPQMGWHPHLIPDLKELGPVTLFDYTALGYNWNEFNYDAGRRKSMNALVLPALKEAHKRLEVDWIFVYASGVEILASTITRITEEYGIPTVNMCLDDKQSWIGPRIGEQRSGQIDIANCFDLSWTSASVACEWYLVEGGRPLYLPEGFNVHAYSPTGQNASIPVSFIGGAYGFRPSVVSFLRKHDVPIHVFGPGWGTREVWEQEQVNIINQSIINLGMGGIGYSESLTNVKTRDFEIPGTGGGVYLTSYNSDLARHFDIGREILCYRNREEMLELIRFYLAHPEQARSIAARGRERCLREHRWLHRYQKIVEVLGISDCKIDSTNSILSVTHR